MRNAEKTTPQAKTPQGEKDARDKALDEELDDSFPASDPPQSTQPHAHVSDPKRRSEGSEDKRKRKDKK